MAQASSASPSSRTAGRFVAANYGQWTLSVFSFPTGTGSLQFSVVSPLAVLTDGRQIIPFNTNAPIFVGTEQVTPSAVVRSSSQPGGYLITATFSNAHGAGETVRSATFGLQEGLNDANTSGGGAVVIDSAWVALGGTTTIKNAATVPSGTGIEDVRTGAASGSGGTVTSVSVVTANGFSGTVATATTTPAITLAAATQATSDNTTKVATTAFVHNAITGAPLVLYSAAGTPLPAASGPLTGTVLVVSDATTPSYLGAYVSGGAIVCSVICTGSGWVTC